MFEPKLTVTVKEEIKSDDGRIIILETNIDDEICVLVNIYAPNNIHSQQMFFKKLSEMLRNYANSFIFIGGDFNCPLSNQDKKGGQDLSSKKNVITRIKQLMGSFDLQSWTKVLGQIYICGAFSHAPNKQSRANSSTLVQPLLQPPPSTMLDTCTRYFYRVSTLYWGG